jgi:hypothetical protein
VVVAEVATDVTSYRRIIRDLAPVPPIHEAGVSTGQHAKGADTRTFAIDTKVSSPSDAGGGDAVQKRWSQFRAR